MATNIGDVALVESFLDALDEIRDAAEFERLMLGEDETDVWARLDLLSRELRDAMDVLEARDLTASTWEPSALATLKAQRALERLQARHPDVWERVALGEDGDDA